MVEGGYQSGYHYGGFTASANTFGSCTRLYRYPSAPTTRGGGHGSKPGLLARTVTQCIVPH
jgi:hypothetical protein